MKKVDAEEDKEEDLQSLKVMNLKRLLQSQSKKMVLFQLKLREMKNP